MTKRKSDESKAWVERDDWAQPFLDNLNRNVRLEYIYDVDHGLRPVDDDYYKFKDEFIVQWGSREFERVIYELALRNWNLYHKIKPVYREHLGHKSGDIA